MILALETSTASGSLALLDPLTGDLLHCASFHSERAHNAALFPPLQQLLRLAPGPLSLLVAGSGPGSYGGVRAGISAALGLSLARGCPAIALPSIAALAPDALVVGDARRAAFFTAEIREHTLQGQLALHDADSFRERVQGSTLPVLTMDPAPPLGMPEISCRVPSAACLARLAQGLHADRLQACLRLPLEPLYVRPPFITQAKPGRFPA